MFRATFTILFFVTTLVTNCQGNRIPLNTNELHKKQREKQHVDTYLHTKLLFDAVHKNKGGFEHVDIKDKISDGANETYEKLSTEALHKTTTTVTFLPDVHYFSLDDASIAKNVELIDLQYIVDCNAHTVNVGDYYIGTSESKHKNIMSQANNGAMVGFIFSRQVIATLPLGKNCVRAFTDVVHPIQIMDTKIVSKVEFPYNRIYVPANRGRRSLVENSRFVKPDEPLLLCTNEKVTSKMALVHKVGSGSKKISGIPLDYDYALDVDGNECIDASVTVPGSFNYNHASGTNAIEKTIDFGHGLICTNCYSFLGASILAVFNIFGGKMSTFAFEAKDAGGAGFNIGLTLTNPSFSGSKYINLAGPGKSSSIPITMGLALDIKFGGAWATVKGSGSAIGKASVSSGYTLYEEDYIMYAKSQWSAKHTLTNSNQIRPIYSISGFKLSGVSFTGLVSVSAKIDYSLGGTIPVADVGASIDFSSVLTATAQYVKERSGSASYYLELDYTADSGRRLGSMSNENAHTGCPGHTIHFHIKYQGLNPHENHDLYFNLHQGETNQQYPIMTHKFRSSESGSGYVDTAWTVPYDSKFMSNGRSVKFSVHSNARTNRYFTQNAAKLSMACAKPVFNLPSVITTEKPVQIKWNKDAMRHFEHIKGTDGMGTDVISPKVNLIIVILEGNGSSSALQFADNIANTGSYNGVIPDWLRKVGRRFFMAIHDSREYTKMAWDNSTFFLIQPILRQRASSPSQTISLDPIYIEPIWQNLTTIKNNGNGRSLLGPTVCQGASLSLMLQVEFGFNGFTVLGHKFAMGSINSRPYVIIPQTNFCI